MNAREQIMNRVSAALRHAEKPELGSSAVTAERPAPCSPQGVGTSAERLSLFRTMLESIGGHCAVVANTAAAAVEVQRLLTERDISEMAVSDHALVAEVAAQMAAEAGAPSTFEGWKDRERLLTCLAGLSSAQLGIAETGTLLLRSGDELHREVSLVPSFHIALLRAGDIQPTLGAALSAAHDPDEKGSHLLTLITGPSRTADIELILVVGVHGPKELAVIVIDGD